MAEIDLNLLTALDVLLAEASVTGAARRLGLSPSAMSRTLGRLRAATGDPLLVQAGRRLVPTPYAQTLAARAREITDGARAILTPNPADLNLQALDRTFVIRANEGFISLFAPSLVATLRAAAPGVRLRFAPKPAKEATSLRDGVVDIEIGTAGAPAPELRRQLLLRDNFIGVVRSDHSLLGAPVTAQRYAVCPHVITSRRGVIDGPVDRALAELGLVRNIVVIVPSFLDALALTRSSDLVALIPQSCLSLESNRTGVTSFALPVATPELAIDLIWHPRLDADAAHRWLRGQIRQACRLSAVSAD